MMDEALSSNGSEDKKIVRRFPMKSSGFWFRLIHPPNGPSSMYSEALKKCYRIRELWHR